MLDDDLDGLSLDDEAFDADADDEDEDLGLLGMTDEEAEEEFGDYSQDSW